MTRYLGYAILGLAAAALLGGAGCSDDDTGNNGGDGGLDDGTVSGDRGLGDGDVTTDGAPWTCHVVRCMNHTLECGDCIDNDGDGKTDSQDIECLGPCDNTEGPELNAGVGGELGGPACASDCYWDYGNGTGNDHCYWDHRCDPLAVAPDYPPEGSQCEYDPGLVGQAQICPSPQSADCLSFCLPLTPNGCDCFGCCTFPELEGLGPNGEEGYIWIGKFDSNNIGTCTLAELTDVTQCPPCTPVLDCLNPCGPCEICVGHPEIEPWCNDEDRCPPGVQWCGLPDDPPCPEGFYCITGCCFEPPG